MGSWKNVTFIRVFLYLDCPHTASQIMKNSHTLQPKITAAYVSQFKATL